MIHNRRSIRMKGYDYSRAGLYFITFCVQNREFLFGTIENKQMILNDAGEMIQTEWEKLPQRFNGIELHEFVVMPNHFHGIIQIITPVGTPFMGAQNSGVPEHGNDAVHYRGNDDTAQLDKGTQINERAPTRGAPTDGPANITVGEMMGAFKSMTMLEYVKGVNNLGWEPFDGKLWQRNFYEHIIRTERSYYEISNYIVNNPARWKEDRFYRE